MRKTNFPNHHFRLATRGRSIQKGRVEMWRGGCRLHISVAASFDWRCLSGSTMAPFPHPAHRTGQADFPQPALGQDFTPLLSRATPSAVSEHSLELIGCPISMSDFIGTKSQGLVVVNGYAIAFGAIPGTMPNQDSFANHRWVRFRNFMAAFEDVSRLFAWSRQVSDRAAIQRREPQLKQMIEGDTGTKLGYPAPALARAYYQNTTQDLEKLVVSMADATRHNAHATFDMPRAFGPNGVTNPAGAAPRPKMRFRLRPLVDNDPRAETAELPKGS